MMKRKIAVWSTAPVMVLTRISCPFRSPPCLRAPVTTTRLEPKEFLPTLSSAETPTAKAKLVVTVTVASASEELMFEARALRFGDCKY
mmetsp:Transcript_7601/g.16182  ORF Transcript_7601/g.16182 Transcript_7601/m.16182 type:complete len:88 (-) Transcript_7601:47-310(-)